MGTGRTPWPPLFPLKQIIRRSGGLYPEERDVYISKERGMPKEQALPPVLLRLAHTLWSCNNFLGLSESESHSVVSDSLQLHGLYSPWNSPGQNTGVGSLSLLQGIFPTQVSNPGLPHCGRILYQLSHKESPTILEWVSHPFPSRSSQPSNQTRVSCIADGFFTNWTIREALMYAYFIIIKILSTG